MHLDELEIPIPQDLIAQAPLPERDHSRMMVVHRQSGKIEHRSFLDLADYLNPEDLLIVNQSRVVPSRILGRRVGTGGEVEIFLVKKVEQNLYEALIRATASKKVGLVVEAGKDLFLKVVAATADPMIYLVEASSQLSTLDKIVREVARIPLPPYITRDPNEEDLARYQTIYSKEEGSIAAPTAGLHFTPQAFEKIKGKGVRVDFVTLHVGLGTFLPIKVSVVEEHKMHKEDFHVRSEVLEAIKETKRKGRKVVTVGTTAVRALESAALGFSGSTDIFITPGFHFQMVDAMFTNFHQPKSTLLAMLVAFVGDLDLVKRAYGEAVKERYRFFSYGDCMLVI